MLACGGRVSEVEWMIWGGIVGLWCMVAALDDGWFYYRNDLVR
jgi:hypothetical protein